MRVDLVLWAACAAALCPVRDFRVPRGRQGAMQKDASPRRASAGVGVGAGVGAAAVAAEPAIFALSNTTLVVSADPSRSIYFLNAAIAVDAANVTLPLLLDTGSAMTWVYGESCADAACAGVAKLNTSAPAAGAFNLDYAGDSVSGAVVNGSLTLGSSLAARVAVGVARTAPRMFNGYNISGVIGVAAVASPGNVVSQLHRQGLIDRPQFLVALVTNRSANAAGVGGVVTFGSARDPHPAAVEVAVEPNANGYWLINITAVATASSGGVNVTAGALTAQAIIDTGTTGLVLPRSDADALHRRLFGSGYVADGHGNYAFPCDARDAAVALTVAGARAALNFTTAAVTGNPYDAPLAGFCASMIQGTGSEGRWILGAAFLQLYYTTFDVAAPAITFEPIGNVTVAARPPRSLLSAPPHPLLSAPPRSLLSAPPRSRTSAAAAATARPFYAL